jgi:hypothetical protein
LEDEIMKKTISVLFNLIMVLVPVFIIGCAGFSAYNEESYHEYKSVQTVSNTENNTLIQYNGVYFRSSGGIIASYSYSSYLRFYENGTVIEVSSTGTPEQIKSWFNSDNKNVSIGNYEINGGKINLSVKSTVGSVDYWGDITINELVLSSHSNINGNERQNLKYEFYTW